MKTYHVHVSIHGTMTVTLEAESDALAGETAKEIMSAASVWDWDTKAVDVEKIEYEEAAE